MPKRVVYFSELNNVMKDELLKKGRRYIRENKGDRFYYILPSGNLIFEYRKMFLEGMPGGFDINIITFDDIANNMMNLKNKKYIDSEIKKSILNNIMKELKNEGKINYYDDIAFTKGFINDISKIIGKIKQSLISPEDFLKRCPDTQYYKEIGLI
jgi:ATP-dependent helicase/DNAse subunit B